MKLQSAVAPLLYAVLLTAAPPALAQPVPRSKPSAVLPIVTIPAARDVPFPGTIGLKIDATDTTRRVFHVTETVRSRRARRNLSCSFPNGCRASMAPAGT